MFVNTASLQTSCQQLARDIGTRLNFTQVANLTSRAKGSFYSYALSEKGSKVHVSLKPPISESSLVDPSGRTAFQLDIGFSRSQGPGRDSCSALFQMAFHEVAEGEPWISTFARKDRGVTRKLGTGWTVPQFYFSLIGKSWPNKYADDAPLDLKFEEEVSTNFAVNRLPADDNADITFGTGSSLRIKHKTDHASSPPLLIEKVSSGGGIFYGEPMRPLAEAHRFGAEIFVGQMNPDEAAEVFGCRPEHFSAPSDKPKVLLTSPTLLSFKAAVDAAGFLAAMDQLRFFQSVTAPNTPTLVYPGDFTMDAFKP